MDYVITNCEYKPRVLMLSSVASMIEQFNMNNIQILQNLGYKVEVACNFNSGNTFSSDKSCKFMENLKLNDITYYQIDFDRNAFNFIKNLKAYYQLLNLFRKEPGYKFVHCHSPIGGVLGRIVAHRTGTKVIYTAHGFHFYKGAPIKNWIIYYPIERFLARWTDILITINNEDYYAAQKFHAKRIEQIRGIGVEKNISNLENVNRASIREKFNTDQIPILLLSVGELNRNKNHQIVLKAMSNINHSKLCYIVCGIGAEYKNLLNLAKRLGLENHFKLLGYQADLKEIYEISDIFIQPSKREGLSVALMEAMSYQLPVIASDIRGNNELIDMDGGILCNVTSIKQYSKAIEQLSIDRQKRTAMGLHNLEKIKPYYKSNVSEKMAEIYQQNF